MKRLVVYSLVVLVLNSTYLYFFDSASLVYILNIFLHLGAGLVLTFALGSLLWSQFRKLPWDGQAAYLVLVLAVVTGLILFYTGASSPYRLLLNTHILLSCAGIFLLLVHFWARGDSWKALAVSIFVAAGFPIAAFVFSEQPYQIQNPLEAPVSMAEEGPGPDSPFFPSSANTNVDGVIPSDFFMNSESCARSGCHPDIYQQWQTSAHRFASFNNQWYRKSIEYMQDVVGTEPSKWCAGCHDHALFFSGMMDTPIKEQLDRPEAHAGLTCTSCHSITQVRNTMGNGGFVIEYPPLHDLATSENPILRYLHDFVVELDPEPHKKTFMKPFMRQQSSEYCSSCHKVHLDVPVNDYRWLRGFNEYDGWQSSGVSGQGARSFYYPDEPKECVDCHMPLTPSDDAGNIGGVVHDHRFPGANTALPLANAHEDQLNLVRDFLQADQIGVDIFALSETSEEESRVAVPNQQRFQVASTFAEGDEMGFAVGGRGAGYTETAEIIAPIDRINPVVHRGNTVRVDVVVRTKGVGHFFPGGTVDAFDVWVELKAQDESGRLIFWSGYVPEDENGRKGEVDPGAHFYRSYMLDERGNPVNKRNAFATRAVAYVRLIPPGAADTVHYRLEIPSDVGDRIYLTAKVNYRKFSWWNTHFSYAGVRDPNDPDPEVGPGYDDGKWVFTGDTSDVSGQLKEIPDLPIITMAESEAVLQVVDSDQVVAEQKSIHHQDDLIRWNDYGIGLLLQGDLKAAEEVFQQVTEIDPSYADGWVNIARARFLEGRNEEAQTVLFKALEIDPELAKTHFFLGMTYKNMGDYDTSLKHLRKAESQYPRDRVVLNQIGRILFLQRNFEKAVEVLNRVLRVDPEDLQAHYNLMLCYRALRNNEKAAREQALYLRFKADENSQAITGPFLRENPEVNNERQAIHEHTSFPLDQIRQSNRLDLMASHEDHSGVQND